MKFNIYQSSRQGPRKNNEDRVAYAYSKDALLAVLADGMGGHCAGEVAAQFAIDTLTTSFQRLALPMLDNPRKFLEQHIRQTHDAILQHALLNDMPESPCTTLVAAVVQHGMLYCAHAGDSRLYHFRAGKLLFRTEDHSKVQKLFRMGMIGEAELLTHPERSKIYNCVGGEAPPEVQFAPRHRMENGDVVLLCSDGLWSLLTDTEMTDILRSGPVTDTVPLLFSLAESRADGSGDNMSAIAFNWSMDGQHPFTISTASMPLSLNTAIMDPSPIDHDEVDIEIAIAEIHAALEKVRK